MGVQERIELILRPPTEEVVTEGDLVALLESEGELNHYIGFEISGLMHLGTLFLAGYKIRDFMEAGINCTVFLADWHSYINNKFGGDWDLIKRAAEYYKEAFNYFCPGVKVILGSDLYSCNDEYWENLIKFSKHITLARVTRCLTIMGRSERERLDFSQYLYPSMQSVDIWALGVNIAHAGIDQRKVHMLAREVFPKMGWSKPIAIHHALLPGLGEPKASGLDEDKKMDSIISSKMSKSKPWTCIFIHDSDEEIESKVRAAWCPPNLVEGNPILEITRLIIMHEKPKIEIERPIKFGGDITFDGFHELKDCYAKGQLHPADLKAYASRELSKLIAPIRSYFERHEELLEPFKSEV